ncbi:MAG: transketolase [Syntrophomonadaceae bacterium]|nr:transketolase [Syntrophomonadaceae bacterium]
MREINDQMTAELEEKAKILRQDVSNMLGKAGSGHPGGALSAADIMTCLYFWEMRYDSQRPDWTERDRFVLSKGHVAPVLYAALAEGGFFSREKLATLRQLGSPLQGHPDLRKLPGVEASTGSLGQGFGWAVGMAMAAKLDRRDSRIYVLLGDGEMQEGIVWESVMAANQYKLDNLVAIVDNNGMQIDGRLSEIMSVEPIAPKLKEFGWNTREIDGHHIPSILKALEEARSSKGKPFAIVAKTIKGKGCSFMENQVDWHGKAPSADQIDQALQELA